MSCLTAALNLTNECSHTTCVFQFLKCASAVVEHANKFYKRHQCMSYEKLQSMRGIHSIKLSSVLMMGRFQCQCFCFVRGVSKTQGNLPISLLTKPSTHVSYQSAGVINQISCLSNRCPSIIYSSHLQQAIVKCELITLKISFA